MTELLFKFPSISDRGYLRRQKLALALHRDLQENQDPESIDRLVDFLVPFVSEPSDPEAAREAVWDIGLEQLTEIMTKYAESQTPPKSSGKSATGPAEPPA